MALVNELIFKPAVKAAVMFLVAKGLNKLWKKAEKQTKTEVKPA